VVSKTEVTFVDWDNRAAVLLGGSTAWAVLFKGGPWEKLPGMSALDVAESGSVLNEDDFHAIFGPFRPWPAEVASALKEEAAFGRRD